MRAAGSATCVGWLGRWCFGPGGGTAGAGAGKGTAGGAAGGDECSGFGWALMGLKPGMGAGAAAGADDTDGAAEPASRPRAEPDRAEMES